ncbi:MAG: hypothetical protein K8R39_01600 [Arcobacteraceae bacterium]|nr:hypothetical protein [Arcobacteraceae bacterium]
MIRKVCLILIIPLYVWSSSYDLVLDKNYSLKNIQNKKIAIISNIGNVFTSYDDNPYFHKRYYSLVENWGNDKFIQNKIKDILESKGFTNVSILDPIKEITLIDKVRYVKILHKEAAFALGPLIIDDKFDLIIYIEKVLERDGTRPISINKVHVNNTNFGLEKYSYVSSNTQELLISTLSFICIFSKKDIIKDMEDLSYYRTYLNHTDFISNPNNIYWMDTSFKPNIKTINSFEKKIKKLFSLNIEKFVQDYIKFNE